VESERQRLAALLAEAEAEYAKEQVRRRPSHACTPPWALMSPSHRTPSQADSVRRRHDYFPFLLQFLRVLNDKGDLVPLVERARGRP
jgi:hypothetical protein